MSPRFKGSASDIKGYAFKLLGYRSRSRKELLQRLKKKGFPPGEIDSTIHFLEQRGFLDDENVARELLRDAVERKHYGRRGIKNLLAQRGIGKELINVSLLSLNEEKEMETAVQFVQKKMKSLRKYSQPVIRRRLWGMLQRRGFSRDIINSALRSIEDLR